MSCASSTPVGVTKNHTPAVSLRVVSTKKEVLEGQVDKVSQAASKIISSLAHMDEAEIIHERKGSQLLGAQQLRIELACDAELWTRDRAKRGRGNVDVDGVGISVALAKKAREMGCSPKTIKRNAKMFFLFKDILDSTVHVLPDKGFYLVAMESPDPHRALNEFLQKKSSNTKFSVADAGRMVRVEKQASSAAKTKLINAHRSDENKALETHILWAIEKIQKEIKSACPNLKFSKNVWNPLLLDLREYLDTMFSEDVKQALRSAYDAGFRKEDQIAKATGLSRAEVSQYMKDLEKEGEFVLVEQGGETDQAKGMNAKLWRKVA